MARTTLKSQQIIIDQLTAQVAELTTQVGVLMSSLEASNQDRKALSDERDALITENEQLITILSEQPATTVKTAPQLTVAASVVESQSDVIEVTDFDVAMYRKFKALSREQRLAIIEFARPHFGHVGVHNIVEVRAAWHEHRHYEDLAMTSIDIA